MFFQLEEFSVRRFFFFNPLHVCTRLLLIINIHARESRESGRDQEIHTHTHKSKCALEPKARNKRDREFSIQKQFFFCNRERERIVVFFILYHHTIK